MILQALPDPRQVVVDSDADAAQILGGANTPELQDVGEPIDPADRITSRSASARSTTPRRSNSPQMARLPSNRMRRTGALATTCRFGRFIAGSRWVHAALARRRPTRVCWQQPMPPCGGEFTSSWPLRRRARLRLALLGLTNRDSLIR
jgi:hypothetical protein